MCKCFTHSPKLHQDHLTDLNFGPEHSAMVSILAYWPSCPGFDSQLSRKIVDVAKVNQWRCFEESDQWLENVDQTHLVLASDKLALRKKLWPRNVIIQRNRRRQKKIFVCSPGRIRSKPKQTWNQNPEFLKLCFFDEILKNSLTWLFLPLIFNNFVLTKDPKSSSLSTGGRHSTEVAFAHLTQPSQVRFSHLTAGG